MPSKYTVLLEVTEALFDRERADRQLFDELREVVAKWRRRAWKRKGPEPWRLHEIHTELVALLHDHAEAPDLEERIGRIMVDWAADLDVDWNPEVLRCRDSGETLSGPTFVRVHEGPSQAACAIMARAFNGYLGTSADQIGKVVRQYDRGRRKNTSEGLETALGYLLRVCVLEAGSGETSKPLFRDWLAVDYHQRLSKRDDIARRSDRDAA